jgi:hypothetical protein
LRPDRAYAAAFSADMGRTIVIFKKHSDENAGSNGLLRHFNPSY